MKTLTSWGGGKYPITESFKACIHLFIQQALTECQPLCGDHKGKHSSCTSSYSQYCATTSLPDFWFSTLQAIPQNELDILQFSSIHLKSLPGDSVWPNRVRVSLTRLTPPLQMPIRPPGYLLLMPLTNWLYKSEVPTTPSLHLVNLLEWLKQLREAFYLHLPVYY